MAEESGKGVYQSEGMKPEEEKAVESTDRGLFDFMKKEDDQMASEFENKVHVSKAGEERHKNKHEGFVQKIHRSDHSSSSSSSDEGEGDDEEKRRRKKEKKEKKKRLKEKIMEKLPGHEDEKKKELEHHHHEEETNVPVEKVHEELHPSHPNKPPQEAEERKGFMDKIKEKLPGRQKADEHEHEHEQELEHKATSVAAEHHEAKEKKGIFEKIKEKIPGFHSKGAIEEKKDTTH